MNIELPEEVTKTVYLYMNTRYDYIAASAFYDPDDEETTLLAEPIEVTFKTIDRNKIVNDAIKSLRNEIQKVRAAAEVKCNQLEEEIQSYLALPSE
jgi:hypothetical protein